MPRDILRTMQRLVFFFLILVCHTLPLAAMETGGEGVVQEIIDGDTLFLDDGRQVRLVGIQAPKLALGRRGFKAWPLAGEAKTALAGIALGKPVALSFGGAHRDRHGRLLAHLYLEDGLWIQGEMIARGMARVYSFPDNRELANEMLAQEETAREEGRGIWNHAFYAVRSPDETEALVGSFQLVEGEVLSAAVVRGRGYLNFGNDYRSDFTISIPPKSRRLFEKEGIDLSRLEGSRVRVGGWLKSFNGPMIEATHPEQIEIIRNPGMMDAPGSTEMTPEAQQ